MSGHSKWSTIKHKKAATDAKRGKLFTRLADTPDSELPTLDELLALRKTDARIAAVKTAGGTQVSGKVWIAQAGVRGSVTIYIEGSDRYANHMDFGKFGRIDAVASGGE